MIRAVCAISMVGLAGTTAALAASDGSAQTPAASAVRSVPVTGMGEAADRHRSPEEVLSPAAAAPMIVVHNDGPPTDPRDGRVGIGGIKISMAAWAAPDAPPAPASSADAARPTDLISVPANTLGPGESLWRAGDRLDSERKLADAQTDFARARAVRAEKFASDAPYSTASPYRWFGGYDGYGAIGGYSGAAHRSFGRRDGLYGPVTTTITPADALGSTAQRAFSEAAYPRLNGSQDARDRAVSQFGRDATPPIVPIQNDVDRVHTNASKEHLVPPHP